MWALLSGRTNHNINVGGIDYDALAAALSRAMGAGAQQGVDAFFRTLNQNMAQNGQGSQAINNLFRSFADQFRNNGEGTQGMQNFFAQWQHLFTEGGQARAAMRAATGETTRVINHTVILTMAKMGAIGVLTYAGLAGGYFGTKALIEEWLRNRKRPQIIIESSYYTPWQRLKNFVSQNKKEEMNMIFTCDLQNRLDEIAKSTKNINHRINEGKTNVQYRNLMLYGKPGTGKTMFARKLAHECGMEFAMMSGSSFTKQGALEEMDHLFKWANNSKGLLLFIDEAESFLLKRETMKTDSYEYKVLTNFLNYTGTRSNKFMIVMATNRLSQIDSAIYRRVDDLVEIGLPAQEERARVLMLYRDTIMFDVKQNGQAFVDSSKAFMTDSKIKEMAAQTNGLSNGDLQGIINSIKTSSDITGSGLLTQHIVDTAVQRYVQKQREFATATA
jgi:ATPase family AAA domain-containing protein 3A/B